MEKLTQKDFIALDEDGQKKLLGELRNIKRRYGCKYVLAVGESDHLRNGWKRDLHVIGAGISPSSSLVSRLDTNLVFEEDADDSAKKYKELGQAVGRFISVNAQANIELEGAVLSILQSNGSGGLRKKILRLLAEEYIERLLPDEE